MKMELKGWIWWWRRRRKWEKWKV